MKVISALVIVLVIGVAVYLWHQGRKSNHDPRMTDTTTLEGNAVATFAGGCFWCVESDFEKVPGVIEVVSGYTGGDTENPAYKEVASGGTGHREAVQVYYDPAQVTYGQLLDVFWTHVNPTDAGGQFADRGFQYSTAIFYHDDEQKQLAEQSKAALELSDPVVTEIVPAGAFYIAEDYHQDYHIKNPLPYAYYREGSGRNAYIEETWGETAKKVQQGMACVTNVCSVQSSSYTKPSDTVLKEMLTPLQYDVTQNEGTEKPFENAYWDNKEEGIYVDIVTGEPLFSS